MQKSIGTIMRLLLMSFFQEIFIIILVQLGHTLLHGGNVINN